MWSRLFAPRNALLPIAGIFSIINIVNFCFTTLDISALSLAVSAAGIAAVLFFITGSRLHRYLLMAWILGQMIVISRDYGNGYTESVFDLTQFFKLTGGITLGSNGTRLGIYFNFLTFLYLFLYRMAKTNALLGKAIPFRIVGGEDIAAHNITGLVKGFATIDRDRNWLVVSLTPAIKLPDGFVHELYLKTEKSLLTNVMLTAPDGHELQGRNNSAELKPVSCLVVDY